MGKRIGITLGDCAGIGPEIVDAALKSGRLSSAAEYQIIGRYPTCSLGQPNPDTARAAVAAMEEAATLAENGAIDAVVTGPIHKAHMYNVGFEFPGQTEFFAARSGTTNFAMCLTGGKLTVGLVTTHIALRQVAESLHQSEIVRVGLLLGDFLRQTSRNSGRIGVAGLNPHAGESGKMGEEEIQIIAPAVAELESKLRALDSQIGVTGPYSPDTVFHRAVQGEFDAVLCMYHDQGLIPLKLHAFHDGVNTTLGLPFPRTSPDHGTAFDIAGKGMARADSMIAAINLAAELASNKGNR
ncbi:MAG: 4-hydroxythreonine-4-phosphate dehydrogenase PdxA [Chthoniobacterales bacterium]